MLVNELLKNIFKWTIVILTILFVPYGSVILVGFFTILFFKNKIYNIDLLLLYFLLFFIQQTTGGSESALSNIRFLLIPLSFLRTVGQKGFTYYRLFQKPQYFSLLLFFLILHSIIFSFNTTNSLFELGSFIVLIFFTFKNTYFENILHKIRIITTIEGMYIAIIILSFLSFASPAISYARNGVGFQGVSIHPNAFGVILAPFCGWVLLKLIKKFSLINVALFVISIVFVLLSLSRTSFLSIFLGLLLIIIVDKDLRVIIFRKIFLLLLISSSFIIIYFSSISGSLVGFLDKGKTGSVEESVLMSRGSLINKQIYNIENNPFFGIGFKNPSDLKIVTSAISSSKAYEKGNMLLAITEELGIVGLLVLVYTIISILKIISIKKGQFLLLAFIALFTTLGEATLFSIGGIGVIIWTFIFLSFHNGRLQKSKIKELKTSQKLSPVYKEQLNKLKS